MSATSADFSIASTRVRCNRGNRMLFSFQSRPRDMGVYPGVLVLHDIEGNTDAYHQATRRLARADFVGSAFDIYSRAEAPNPKKPLDDNEKKLKWFCKLPDERVFEDLDLVWSVLEKLHWTRGQKLGVLGFGLGAYYALLFASLNQDVASCVAVNPRFVFDQPEVSKRDKSKGVKDLKPVKFTGALTNSRAGCFVFLPGQDEQMPLDKGQQLLDMLDRQSMKYGKVVYDQAHAGFWDPASEGYNKAYTEDMWDGILGFFKQTLK